MHIFKKIEREIRLIIEQMKSEGVLPESTNAERIEATPPRDAAHGDIATNAAMVLGAQLGKNPKELAGLLADRLRNMAGIVKADIAGPGFINLTLSPSIWQESVLEILEQGPAYGNSELGQGQKINVEYVSANPTGPMHVGHARYIYGDALANLLIKAGYNVTKEYYINDAGSQIEKVADSVFLRYREASGETITEIPEGLYPGDYLIPIGQGLFKIYGKALLTQPRDEWFPVIRTYALEQIMIMIKGDLAALGIHFDIFSSEQAIRDAGKVDEAIATLESKNLIYTGVLEAPKGKAPEDWEAKPQTLFRATQFGDDSDRAVKKSDGAWTYFAPDIAYQLDKINRGYDKLIMLLGVDHGGYVKRLKAAVSALSDNRVELEVKLCQLVKFMRNGEPLKMSKRAGTFVTVREVIDEVGKDVFRFIMLTRKNDMPHDFDFAKVTEQSKDNPVFYVQYAHARAHSIMRRAAEEMPEALCMVPGVGFQVSDKKSVSFDTRQLTSDTLSLLSHPHELALIRLMCSWPRMVESAAIALEPHRIAFYLQELAASFHGFWNFGNDDLTLRFIVKNDIELTAARIALARAESQVIASGLAVLGVEPMEELR